jgi:excisionase family DNA binding protein
MEATWSVAQVCDYLGSTPNTIRVWCSKRRIPYVKVGRKVRFIPADLRKWVEEGRIDPLPRA